MVPAVLVLCKDILYSSAKANINVNSANDGAVCLIQIRLCVTIPITHLINHKCNLLKVGNNVQC